MMQSSRPPIIYLDYNATTPVDPRVLETMLPWFTTHFGNAASNAHAFGWEAAEAVSIAREQVAQLVGAIKEEIIFTSGATESINLAIKGVVETYHAKGNHIITCATEHKAVLDSCAALEKKGYRISYLPVDEQGLIRMDDLKEAITPETILIAIMMANNETGVLQSTHAIGQLAKANKILFFCDATQAVGKIPVDVIKDEIDLLAFSSHKIYGPKGVGALYVRRKNPRVTLKAQIDGGGHEKNLRSGTLNVPGIVGFGKAAELARLELDRNRKSIETLRNYLEAALLATDFVSINGNPVLRLPNTSNLCFKGLGNSNLVAQMSKQLAVSSGSACTSNSPEPSHVLSAMGLTDFAIRNSIRFSLGNPTTQAEIETSINILTQLITKMSTDPNSA